VTYSYTVVEWTLSVKAKWQAMPGDDEQSIAFDTLTVALRFQSIRRYLSLTQLGELVSRHWNGTHAVYKISALYLTTLPGTVTSC